MSHSDDDLYGCDIKFYKNILLENKIILFLKKEKDLSINLFFRIIKLIFYTKKLLKIKINYKSSIICA